MRRVPLLAAGLGASGCSLLFSRNARVGSCSLSFADDVGGVELNEELAQLRELLCPQLPFELGLDLADGVTDVLEGGVASFGEVNAFGALVFGIIVAGEISELLHLPQQVAHCLLGHAGFGSKV